VPDTVVMQDLVEIIEQLVNKADPPPPDKSDTYLHMSLHNVVDVIERTYIVEKQQILEEVTKSLPTHTHISVTNNNNVTNVIVAHVPPKEIDPNVQKELDLVEHMLIAGQNVDVPSTPYLAKFQRRYGLSYSHC